MNGLDVARVCNEGELRRADRVRPTVTGGTHVREHHRALVEQRRQGGPGRQIEYREDLQAAPRMPGSARLPLRVQLAAEHAEIELQLPIGGLRGVQYVDELPGREHRHLAM